jgi:CheY-like chemotaxis protein
MPPPLLPRLEILVIENNPADARLTLEALKEIGRSDGVVCVPDGEEAMSLLRRAGPHSEASRPHIIFLDLDLPRTSGMKVLEEIKTNAHLKVIPVVVVSGCSDPKEVRKAYELHANCFIYKPGNLEEFLRFVHICYEFWGGVVTLPD